MFFSNPFFTRVRVQKGKDSAVLDYRTLKKKLNNANGLTRALTLRHKTYTQIAIEAQQYLIAEKDYKKENAKFSMNYNRISKLAKGVTPTADELNALAYVLTGYAGQWRRLIIPSNSWLLSKYRETVSQINPKLTSVYKISTINNLESLINNSDTSVNTLANILTFKVIFVLKTKDDLLFYTKNMLQYYSEAIPSLLLAINKINVESNYLTDAKKRLQAKLSNNHSNKTLIKKFIIKELINLLPIII